MRARGSTHQFTLGGQHGWWHDEGWAYGPLHTYDALKVAGEEDRARKVHILLPHDYAESASRYPVVYMNDGQTAFFPGGPGPDSWRVGETVGELVSSGKIGQIIVVAVHPVDRDREYTHAPWFPGKPWGGLPGYSDYVAGPLKTWIDATYRTHADRDSTSVIGSSHGGLAAFHIACAHPATFGFAGALSPSFWVGGRGPNDASRPLTESALLQVTRTTLENRALRPRLWVDWGLQGDGATRGARAMAALLEAEFGYVRGVDLDVVEDAEGSHDERTWGRRLSGVLEACFRR